MGSEEETKKVEGEETATPGAESTEEGTDTESEDTE